MSSSTTWTVTGMTCAHCASAVSEEIRKIEGVTDVSVDVDAGRVTISSTAPVAAGAVAEAVDEAGYELVHA